MITLKASSKVGSTPRSTFDLENQCTVTADSEITTTDLNILNKMPPVEKYQNFEGNVFQVDLDKGESGIGLSILQGKGSFSDTMFIVDVKPGSPAFQDGRIQKGDEILEVNGTKVKGLSYQLAADTLRKVENHVTLIIGHPFNLTKFDHIKMQPPSPPVKIETMFEYHTIILQKNCTCLGFAIGVQRVGERSGIFILNVTEGGTAYQDGRLQVGDEITMINKHPLKGLSQFEAVSIIHALKGEVVIDVCREVQVPILSSQSVNKFNETKENELPSFNSINMHFDSQNRIFGNMQLPSNESISRGVKIIHLESGSNGLGFSIVSGLSSPKGSVSFFVKAVFDDGAAAKDNRLKHGDQILSVNEKNLKNLTPDVVKNLLQNTKGIVKLAVLSSS